MHFSCMLCPPWFYHLYDWNSLAWNKQTKLFYFVFQNINFLHAVPNTRVFYGPTGWHSITCMWEVPGSNLGWLTSHTELEVSHAFLPSVSTGKCSESTLKWFTTTILTYPWFIIIFPSPLQLHKLSGDETALLNNPTLNEINLLPHHLMMLNNA